MSKCWYCNEELTTGNNPEHIGICDKCYDEMFRYGEDVIRDMTNKIKDLETKLAEKEKQLLTYVHRISEQNEELANRPTMEDLYPPQMIKLANQDKISFAVEQLEKVKEWCEDNYDTFDDKINNCEGKVIGLDKVIFNADTSLYDFIDNQIKRLKEGK